MGLTLPNESENSQCCLAGDGEFPLWRDRSEAMPSRAHYQRVFTRIAPFGVTPSGIFFTPFNFDGMNGWVPVF
jgi:hypothetical protein